MASQADLVIAELVGVTEKHDGMPEMGLFTMDSEGVLTRTGTPMGVPTSTTSHAGSFCDTGYTDLMVHHSEGDIQFYAIGIENTFAEIGKEPVRIEPYSNVYTGNFQKDALYTGVLTRLKGKLQFYSTDGKGGMTPYGNSTDISISANVLLGHFDLGTDMTDLAVYEDGSLQFFTLDGNGNLKKLGEKQKILNHCTGVVGGFGGGSECSDIMFTSYQTNETQFFKTLGDGKIEPIGDLFNCSQLGSSYQIISGTFAGGDTFDNTLVSYSDGSFCLLQTDGKGGVSQIGKKNTDYSFAQFFPINIVR